MVSSIIYLLLSMLALFLTFKFIKKEPDSIFQPFTSGIAVAVFLFMHGMYLMYRWIFG